jgi:hypothetical protein
MLGLDLAVAMTKAWSDAMLGMAVAGTPSTQVVNGAFASRFAPEAPAKSNYGWVPDLQRGPAARSWYRTPTSHPIEVFFTMTLPFYSKPAWPMPFATSPFPALAAWPSLGSTLEVWATMLRLTRSMPFTNPWSVWSRVPAFNGMSWFAGQACPSPNGIAMPTFASYRSYGGHAVTQIRLPNDVIASVAMPVTALGFAAFAWPALLPG